MSAYILLSNNAEAEDILISDTGQTGIEVAGNSCRVSAIRFASGSWSTGNVLVTGDSPHITDIESPAPSYAIVALDGSTDFTVDGVRVSPSGGSS